MKHSLHDTTLRDLELFEKEGYEVIEYGHDYVEIVKEGKNG
jgi:hypothetical protein